MDQSFLKLGSAVLEEAAKEKKECFRNTEDIAEA